MGVEKRAAGRAAPGLLEVAKAQWAAGQSPTGEIWPLTEAGDIALVDLTAQGTVRAEGAELVLKLPDVLTFHQHPHQAGHPRRQVVPEDGDPVPPAWEVPIADAVRAELDRLGS